MSEEETRLSLALYQYLCRNIVGSEETVKTKRMLMTILDNLYSNDDSTIITSGSFGEGLEMKGSDFDYMNVLQDVEVYENKSDIKFDPSKTYFEIYTDDTKLGFVKLLFLHSLNINHFNSCVKDDGKLFLSNVRFKSYFQNLFSKTGGTRYSEINHGPCLSDKNGMFDYAVCLHSKSLIRQAKQWVYRSSDSWPSNEVVSKIKQHGLLFVPIGIKGSPKEEIEWRFSFSVGEKLLIYSFIHTQLLCYALLKLVLKDIISTDDRCKDLLCSYYLKNIVFWVSEEIPLSSWKPQNLIHCFMQCFKRLLYCVEYSLCPHYFISEINMFENKIEGENRQVLLDKLYTLYNFSWRCILFSPLLYDFYNMRVISTTLSQPFVDDFQGIISSSVLNMSKFMTIGSYAKSIKTILSPISPAITLCQYFLLQYPCHVQAAQVQLSTKDKNKSMYRKYRTCQSYLLQGLHFDSVSGWLKLASFYYHMKHYRAALMILLYALSKCSKDKICGKSKLSLEQRGLLSLEIFQNKGLIRVLQLLRIENVILQPQSTLIPRELELEKLNGLHLIPPVVFAHFLTFMCHYRLRDVREYMNSLTDLQLTISENYFIRNSFQKSSSYNTLGIVLQIIGQNESAREAFRCAIQFDPEGAYSCARQRLSMMDML